MPDLKKYRVGQWVRFYWNGELRIAEVRYIREAERYPHRWECVTDLGIVEFDSVLEAR